MWVCLSTSAWGTSPFWPLSLVCDPCPWSCLHGQLTPPHPPWATKASCLVFGIGRVLCALEFYINILNRVKVSKIGMVSIDQHLHRIKRGVLDSILKPEGLEVLGKRRNPILLEACMLVMLLNVKVYVLVKVEVLAVSLILEGMQFGHNGAPG
jgi:hypothetical protein